MTKSRTFFNAFLMRAGGGKDREEGEKAYMDNLEPAESRFLFRSIREEEIGQAAEIEQICFPPNEACTPERMRRRILAAPELFLVAVDPQTGRIAGFLNGIARKNETHLRDAFFTDETLHQRDGNCVMLLGLDVLPQYRHQGLARALMGQYAKREKSRSWLVLTCLADKVKMYRSFGFEDRGVSDSAWGGEEWHEMVMPLQK